MNYLSYINTTKKCSIYLAFFLSLSNFCFSQSNNPKKRIDSLFTVLKTVKEDTNKVKTMYELAFEKCWTNPDTAIIIDNHAMILAKKLNWIKGILRIERDLGVNLSIMGNFKDALEKNLRTLKYCEKYLHARDKQLAYYAIYTKGQVLNNIGNIYTAKGRIKTALEYYLKATEVAKKANDQELLGGLMCNIGNAYADPQKKLSYYLKAIDILNHVPPHKQTQTKQFIAIITQNIGSVYEQLSDYKKAITYGLKSLDAAKLLGDKTVQANASNQLAMAHKLDKNYDLALKYADSLITIRRKLMDKSGIAQGLNLIGQIKVDLKQYRDAEIVLLESQKSAKEEKVWGLIASNEEQLSLLYEKTGKTSLALQHYKNFYAARDTLKSHEASEKLIEKDLNNEFNMKERAMKIEQDKKDLISNEKLKQKEKERNYFMIGFGIVLILVLIIYREFRDKKKANKLVIQQKMILEAKQKEIIDSIYYARRIQDALLPSQKYIEKKLKDLN